MNINFSGRARFVALAILAVTFAAGMLAGAAYSRVLGAREPEAAAKHRDEPRRWRGQRGVLDSLGLSEVQRTRIDSIAAAGRRHMDSLWEVDGVRMRASVDSTRAAIRGLMTQEQRDRYDSIRARFDAERSKHHRGGDSTHPGGPPPPGGY